METQIDEIADGVYRLSTFPDAGPAGFTFNQFLVDAEEPLLFHTGPRRCSRSVASRGQGDAGRPAALDHVRPLRGRRVRRDERVPRRRAERAGAHGALGCMVCRQRPGRPAAASARWPTRCSTSAASASATSTRRTSRTAGTRGLMFEETTARCSAATCHQRRAGPALDRRRPRRRPRLTAEDMFQATCLTPRPGPRSGPGRPRAAARCDHARLVVRGRLRRRAPGLADDYDRRVRGLAGRRRYRSGAEVSRIFARRRPEPRAPEEASR